MNNKDKEELREIIQDEVSKQLNKYFEKEPTQILYIFIILIHMTIVI